MFFWNRVEIYCGLSQAEFSELKNSLALAGIRYDYKLVNHSSRNRARYGTLGINMEYSTLYYLYVHQRDYEQAMYLTSNRQSKLHS